MSNIKETNLEYFTEWNNAETVEDKIRVNKSWAAVGFDATLYYMAEDTLYNLGIGEVIKRKRKTIVINGVEVVAPRYDLPTGDTNYYWISPLSNDGAHPWGNGILNSAALNNLAKNGWFDNEADIKAFLAAIKGNTNE